MKPKHGLTTEVKIIKFRDADTPIVEIRRQFPVRLLDTDHEKCFNAPEKNTNAGKQAKELAEKIVEGKEITLFVPTKNVLSLTDINSFDRIVGEIWVDDKKLTDILFEAGYGEYRDY